MNSFHLFRRVRLLLVGALFGAAAPVYAGPINLNTFYEFSFENAGTFAKGCDPADPAGNFCVPSSGTPTQFLNAPPWTFNAPTFGVLLAVTDAFEVGDRFEVFDFGASLGLTSLPGGAGDCGDDPVPCLANPAISKRFFVLGGGAHSITIRTALSPFGGGAAYLRAEAIPEPATLVLLITGLGGLGAARRRWRRPASTGREHPTHTCS